MTHHLKPLIIQAKINGVRVNKVLVDGGATVNLLSQSILSKIGLIDSDLKPHNVVLTNYEGMNGNSLCDVEVELIVGSVSRTTMFMWSHPKQTSMCCWVENGSMVWGQCL